MKGSIRLALIALMLLGLAPLGAAAQDSTPSSTRQGLVFSVVPAGSWPHGYVELELKPGASTTFKAQINTEGTEHASLVAFIGDALNSVNGGFAVGDISAQPTRSATWATLDKSSFELDPGAQTDITVTVTVPKDAKPGQYISGLVVQTAKPLGSGTPTSGFSLLPVIRSAMPIMITVPGDLKAGFTLGDPTLETQNGTPVLTAPIENTGNVLVKPAGTISISSPDGTVLVSSPVQMGSVYAGNSTALQVTLPDQFAPGDYVVSIDLTDAASGVTASKDAVPVTLSTSAATPVTFSFGVTVKADGDPVRFANVTVPIANGGSAISTATVNLHVFLNGNEVEVYPLATNQAIPAGDSTITQRYIPTDDWQSGTYSFAVEIVVTNGAGGTESTIGTVQSNDTIVVP